MKSDTNAIDSNFRQISRTTLQQQIVGQIELLIDDGKLKHGDRLPPERKLAEIFEVSRHSVREAIRTLEEKGILKSKPGSGTFVILEDKSSVLDYIADVIRKEKTEQKEVFEFRRLLEPQIAGLAAKNAKAEDIDNLKRILDRQKSGEAPDQVKKQDQDFHMGLARATGNKILVEIVELLTEIIDKSRIKRLISEKRYQKSVRGHSRILEAVMAQDEELARQTMLSHITEIEKTVTGS